MLHTLGNLFIFTFFLYVPKLNTHILNIASTHLSTIQAREQRVLTAMGANTLLVPFLGQSNAQNMSDFDREYPSKFSSERASGATVLERVLREIAGYEVKISDREATNFAVGGSKVNGSMGHQRDEEIWWYPEENRPGGALLAAERNLEEWLAAEGGENPDLAIVWGQGEGDTRYVGLGSERAAAQYKESTEAVFDYLQDKFGDNAKVKFYIMQTGRYQEDGAKNRGIDSQDIEITQNGVRIIRGIQEEIALYRDDVQLATDYSDLDLVYDEGKKFGDSYEKPESSWSIDTWHLGHEAKEVTGRRLAEYIALDRGKNHVLSFTDAYGNNSSSIALPRNGLLDINLQDSSTLDLIKGTDAPDIIVGTFATDNIMGEGGDDVIISGRGVDTLAGGGGSDVFFFDPSVYSSSPSDRDLIIDFEVGSSGDRLDVYELLELSGYDGSDPVADGYIDINEHDGNSTEIRFNPDGIESESSKTIAILQGVNRDSFKDNASQNLIVTPTEF